MCIETVYLDIDSNFDRMKDELRKIFNSATSNTSSTIFLEDIDQLINIENASGKSYEKVITKLLITPFDDLKFDHTLSVIKPFAMTGFQIEICISGFI
jgi:SpoVK/Ycf46/Vps4 family AAA+-type ATPase